MHNTHTSCQHFLNRSKDKDLYAALAHAVLSFLRVALTLEQNDLRSALESIENSFEVSARKRRKTSTAGMMIRLLVRPNYNNYSDTEIHAELVHAESLLLLALISFLADQSIICLVRGALRIRACYQRYKECLYIMDNSGRVWQSEEARQHFESGVRMGHGIFNLLMSYLPARVLRFLEYVGFSGKRALGVNELDKSVELQDGLRSVFSALVILTYHSYIENLFGLGSYDAQKVSDLNARFLAHYPHSAFFLLFRGRYHQMHGDTQQALDNFQRCIEAQDDWKQFHSICHWEMMWCHAVQLDWPRAAHYAHLLREKSKWSQASYTYQYATFLYAQLVEEERAGKCAAHSDEHAKRMHEICAIMRQVPELRMRYAGKTIPAEKFAITRAQRFLQQSNRLTLPQLEFLYVWNVFATLRSSPRIVERILERLDSELTHVDKQLDGAAAAAACTSQQNKVIANNGCDDSDADLEDADHDNYEQPQDEEQEDDDDDELQQANWRDDRNLIMLLRGVCLKLLGKLNEAERVFRQIIAEEHLIQNDTFIAPHTAMELALLRLQQREYRDARKWIKTARTQYTGYLLETMVHFRLHAAARETRAELREAQLAHSSCESAASSSSGAHSTSAPSSSSTSSSTAAAAAACA